MACTHCVSKGEEHNPLCAVGRTERAYARGRTDERAAVVAWLMRDRAPRSVAEDIAAAIERGEHVDAMKEGT